MGFAIDPSVRFALNEAAKGMQGAAKALDGAPLSGYSRSLDPDTGHAVWKGLRDGALGIENAISWSANNGDATVAATFGRESATLGKLLGTYEGSTGSQRGANLLIDAQFVNEVKLHADIVSQVVARFG